MGRLTTHVLDSANGRPGGNIDVVLYRVEGDCLVPMTRTRTNGDGRCELPLLEGDAYQSGVYQLQFSVGSYYERLAQATLARPPFLDTVVIRIGIDSTQDHYHVPLLLAPYGYSTYRGS